MPSRELVGCEEGLGYLHGPVGLIVLNPMGGIVEIGHPAEALRIAEVERQFCQLRG